ncbi:MAG: hypothetical protein R6V56_03455, partial [Lentisphaeria bacterium]
MMEKYHDNYSLFEDGALKVAYRWKELSSEEQERLLAILGEVSGIVRVVYSDMLFSGDFGQGILVKTEEQLIVIDEQETVQTQVPFEQVASIYCRNLVGNGILE